MNLRNASLVLRAAVAVVLIALEEAAASERA